MKIGIQTWGSNGDVRPLLALASGLKQAGHDICLVVSSIENRSYQSECQALNIQYRQIPEHIDFALQEFAGRTFRRHPLQWLTEFLDSAYFSCEAQIYAAAQQLAEENDLLIGHHFLYPLKLAAKQTNKPFVSVTFCHAGIPDATQAPFGFPNLGQRLNPLNRILLETVFNWALKKPLSRLWLEAGYAVPHFMLSEHLSSQTLNLIAVDPLFCPTSNTWSQHNQVCGFLNFTEDSDNWDLPAELQAFLAQGSQPVYMTFGSVQQAKPEWSMALFLQATAISGCRAIIQTDLPTYPLGTQSDHIYVIGKHPHQPVFKHCAAVVHHGGAGTTHAATRSGCPSIVIPFMEEQLFWAKKLQSLGLAGKPLPSKRITAKTLAKELRKVLENTQFQHNAQRAGNRMQNTSGVTQAIALITTRFSALT